ncbi:hypothetical protein CSUB01_12304 [Colletotrichum sublineola]|uniref:Uncharacterized protein n=1 Tax=Colletotrichum sublineola TaxID=1173701 RepID=A0A066XHP7_COLSU|nr:hypothetical protein CSUB01_12304 [Colletotrichum sublineola]
MRPAKRPRPSPKPSDDKARPPSTGTPAGSSKAKAAVKAQLLNTLFKIITKLGRRKQADKTVSTHLIKASTSILQVALHGSISYSNVRLAATHRPRTPDSVASAGKAARAASEEVTNREATSREVTSKEVTRDKAAGATPSRESQPQGRPTPSPIRHAGGKAAARLDYTLNAATISRPRAAATTDAVVAHMSNAYAATYANHKLAPSRQDWHAIIDLVFLRVFNASCKARL